MKQLMQYISFILPLLFIPFINNAQKSIDNRTFKGKIANKNIVVAFNIIDGDSYSFFFYEDELRDIPLSGKLQNDSLLLQSAPSAKNPSGTMHLRLVSNTTSAIGNFICNNKTNPVTIHETNELEVAEQLHPNIRKILIKHQPNFGYTASKILKLNALNFQMKDRQNDIEWVLEEKSGVRFPRIAKQIDLKNYVNEVLHSIHYLMALKNLECAQNIEMNTNVRMFSKDLLSIQTIIDKSCGSLHPSTFYSFLIDLHSGKQWSLQKILQFPALGADAVEDPLGRGLIVILTKLYPQYFTNKDTCNSHNAISLGFYQWVFTEKGLAISISSKSIAPSCITTHLIPFSELKDFKHPQFPYPF